MEIWLSPDESEVYFIEDNYVWRFSATSSDWHLSYLYYKGNISKKNGFKLLAKVTND